MSVDSKHPEFTEIQPDWTQMRDTYEGQRAVKRKRTLYLPATEGMLEDGMHSWGQKGSKTYEAYITRARFPELVREAVEAMLGVMHHKPATIELPDGLEYLRERATARNESLQMLLRRINEQQLAIGRAGLLADVIDAGDFAGQVYLATYFAERIINWDEGRRDGIEIQNLNLVVLEETAPERGANFEWVEKDKYRVLLLTRDESEEAITQATSGGANLSTGGGVYRTKVIRDLEEGLRAESFITPSIRGRTSPEIPFVFVNTKDVTAETDRPPLLGLSNIALGIYRGDADYRQALFMQGQDTLVIIGDYDDTQQIRTGAGAAIRIPNPDGDAKYIGVDSTGLAEMRIALENDHKQGSSRGGQLLDTVGNDKQSGEALRIRVAAKTATLNQIALAGAFALQKLLRTVAVWAGERPEEVIVTPNLDFIGGKSGGKEIVDLMSAKVIGAPIALETIHERMQERGVTDKTFEEEITQIETEMGLELNSQGSSDPQGPANDPQASADASQGTTP